MPEGQCEDQAASAVHVRSGIWWLLPMSSVVPCRAVCRHLTVQSLKPGNKRTTNQRDQKRHSRGPNVLRLLNLFTNKQNRTPRPCFIDLKLFKVDNRTTEANKKKHKMNETPFKLYFFLMTNFILCPFDKY